MWPHAYGLNEIEVDEACCLVDFGINPEAILEGIRHLAVLKPRDGVESSTFSNSNIRADGLNQRSKPCLKA